MKNETKVMTADHLRSVTGRLVEIRQKMSYLTPLAPADRNDRRRKVEAKDLPMLQNRLRLARENREVVPPMLDLPALERDVELTLALSGLLDALNAVRSDVFDTFLSVGGVATTGVAEVSKYLSIANPSQHSRRGRPRAHPTAAVTEPIPIPAPAAESTESSTAMIPLTKQAA